MIDYDKKHYRSTIEYQGMTYHCRDISLYHIKDWISRMSLALLTETMDAELTDKLRITLAEVKMP